MSRLSELRNLTGGELAEAIQGTRDALEWFKSMVKLGVVQVKVAHWPKSFARVLLASGCRTDEAIRLCVNLYQEITDDIATAEQFCQSTKHSADQTRFSQLKNRFRRQLLHRREQLSDWDVQIADVEVGTLFDAKYHDAIETVSPSEEIAEDRIAAVHSPVFRWKDHLGQEQCVPARVVIARKCVDRDSLDHELQNP